jgi:ABC-type polysaccharide/polyol phosphate export permease
MSEPLASGPSRILTQLVDHILIIRALVLRNIKLRYLNRPAGFLLEFFRPGIACIAHYYLFWAINKPMPPGMSLEQYIWAAFTVWLTFIRIYGDLQQPGRVKIPPFPGVTRMHARLAICVWMVIVNATFCYGSVLLMKIFGDQIAFPNIPLTAVVLLLAAILGLGVGMIVEGICRAVPLLEPFFHLTPYLLFISSGIYMTVAMAPPFMANLLLYFPNIHLCDYERYAFNPGYPIYLDSLSYAATCAIGILTLGLLINRRLRYTVGE